jgi:hypothetical protein
MSGGGMAGRAGADDGDRTTGPYRWPLRGEPAVSGSVIRCSMSLVGTGSVVMDSTQASSRGAGHGVPEVARAVQPIAARCQNPKTRSLHPGISFPASASDGQATGVLSHIPTARSAPLLRATRFEGLPDLHYAGDQDWDSGNFGVSECLLTGATIDGAADSSARMRFIEGSAVTRLFARTRTG